MIRLTLLFMTLLLSGCVSGPSIRADDKPGQIFLPISLDGHTIRALWDTGSSFTTVPANDFSFYPVAYKFKVTGLGDSAIQRDVIRIRHAQIGDLKLGLKRAVRLNRKDGLPLMIGVDAFRGVDFSFDPKTTLVTLGEVDKTEPRKWNTLDIGRLGQLIVPVQSAGQSLRAVWDTGASLTTVDIGVVKAHPENFQFVRETKIKDPTGLAFGSRLYRIKRLDIAGLKLQYLEVLASDLAPAAKAFGHPVDMLLGFNAIVQLKWTFLQSEKLWKASPL